MTNKVNRPLGFRTSSTHLEETFRQLREELTDSQADWTSIYQRYCGIVDAHESELNRALAERKETQADIETVALDMQQMTYFGSMASINMLGVILCKLGIDISEVHTRLVTVEKLMRDERRSKQ